MNVRLLATIAVCPLLSGITGCAPGILWLCKRPEITAVSLNPCDGKLCGKETGIPFYLPKPLLIVAKNFRNIEEAKVGLTDTAPIPVGFDDQSKYADLNARTNFNGLNGAVVSGAAAPADPANPNVNTGSALKSAPVLHSAGAPIAPGTVPSDGLAPATFFTYQIVFVPDLTQRYGLKIRGGPGEIRAAMNLVNGWQFTGIGPFYLKDSSTAQDILASGISTRLGGQAAADVLNASADLAKVLNTGGTQSANVSGDEPAVQRLSKTMSQLALDRKPMTLPNYAEIHVYEPHLTPEGQMEWTEIVNLNFNRDYLGAETVTKEFAPKPATTLPKVATGTGNQAGAVGPGVRVLTVDPSVARAAVAGVFGLPADSPALTTAPAGLQAGAVGAVPAGGVNQIQVDCAGSRGCTQPKEFNLFRFGGNKEQQRPKIQNRILTGGGALTGAATTPVASLTPPTTNPTPVGNQAANVPGTPSTTPAFINQPIFNQPGFNPPAAKPENAPPKPAGNQ